MQQKQTYTQEQMDILILENNQSRIMESLQRLEPSIINQLNDLNKKFDKIDIRIDKIDSRIDKLDQKIDSNFHWTLGLILGMYAMGLTGMIGALGHAYGWF